MTTGDRLIGRGIALAGLAFGGAYLAWRISTTLGGIPVWLSAVTLLVEIIGFLSVATLVWAIWPAPVVKPPRPPSATMAPVAMNMDIDVLIRCSGQDTDALRATLLASRHLGSLHVLDLGARPEMAALALDSDAVYIATDPEDLDGLGQALPALAAPMVLLLEAGDIPHPDILATLLPWLDATDVAVVQGGVVASQRDSAEHDAGGRNDKEFERRSLLPSLGTHGTSAFTGSGALFRRHAMMGLSIGHSTRPMVQAEITAALLCEGWRIVAPGGDPVVAVASIQQPDVVESMHACEASGALHLLVGANGALRINSLDLRTRLAFIAMATRPLAGVRRSVVILVLLASLLSGSLPFAPSVFGLVALWLPWFLLTSVGLWLMSGGSLRPGDRLRASMRLLGASWRGLLSPNGRPENPQYAVAGAFGVHHGVASAVAVAAISVRGVSDRLTHTLEPLPVNQTAGLLAVALWSLAGGLDALRLLARRAQARRASRVASSLPSTFADRTALVVDLTPHGAAVICDVDLPVDAHDQLDVVVPTATGCITAILPVTIRNVRADFSGERRYGVQFGPLQGYVADALAEFCLIQPALEVLGRAAVDQTVVDIRPVVVVDERALLPRRIGLRLAALVAVAGSLASSVPSSAEAASAASRHLTGRVVVAGFDTATPVSRTTIASQLQPQGFAPPFNSTDIVVVADPIAAASAPAMPDDASAAGAVVTMVCSIDDGGDDLWGTSDDVYGAPISTTVGADGTYDVEPTGEACWLSIAPPEGYMVPGETSTLESASTPQVVDMSSATIDSIEIVPTTVAASPSAGTGTVDDVVWADLDADGLLGPDERLLEGVTVTLFAADGSVAGSGATSSHGSYGFTDLPSSRYRLGVSNLPNGLVATGVLGMTELFDVGDGVSPDLAIGLRPAAQVTIDQHTHVAVLDRSATTDSPADQPPAAQAPAITPRPGSVAEQKRLLPVPRPDQLASEPDDRSPAAALVVVLLATLMGLSVVAGSVRPGKAVTRRLRTSQ
jgi:hypothetical protein